MEKKTLIINIAGLVKTGYMTQKDWGAGYYDENLQHTDLVKRLLMYGYNEPTKGHVSHEKQPETTPISYTTKNTPHLENSFLAITNEPGQSNPKTPPIQPVKTASKKNILGIFVVFLLAIK